MIRFKFLILLILIVHSSVVLSQQNCNSCSANPLGESTGESINTSYSVTVINQNQNDDAFYLKLQKELLQNLKDNQTFKYINKNAPEYLGDGFLEYATNIYAGEATRKAEEEYAKQNDGASIPADKFESLVFDQAQKLKGGNINVQPKKCFEYGCATLGCTERQSNADLYLKKIYELEEAMENNLDHNWMVLRTANPAIKPGTPKYQEMIGFEQKIKKILGVPESQELLPNSVDFYNSIKYLKEKLVVGPDGITTTSSKFSYGITPLPVVPPNPLEYPVYYNEDIWRLERPGTNFYTTNMSFENTQKISIKVEGVPKQVTLNSIELDPNEFKMHQDNNFSLDGSNFSERVKVPEDNTLNAVYCESSASDLRPTKDANGANISQGDFDYLNYDLSLNRKNECIDTVIKQYNLKDDQIVRVSVEGKSDQEIADMQQKFISDSNNKGKVQVFETFKGEHGDGTSGYKSYFCANDEYAKTNSQLCPAEAVALGVVTQEELKASWSRYGYSEETFQNILNKKYPPEFDKMLSDKRAKDPNYKFKVSHLSSIDADRLEQIYDSARYVKMKIYHHNKNEVVKPEESLSYGQKICSAPVSIGFYSKSFLYIPPIRESSFASKRTSLRGFNDGNPGKANGSMSCGP
jgi:hypothetical protein